MNEIKIKSSKSYYTNYAATYNNMIVTVHYTGTLPDSGEVFDSSEGREPLKFIVGHQQMIPGFERELMGCEVGDKIEFKRAFSASIVHDFFNILSVAILFPLEILFGIISKSGIS